MISYFKYLKMSWLFLEGYRHPTRTIEALQMAWRAVKIERLDNLRRKGR